jgi:hypothetical protein
LRTASFGFWDLDFGIWDFNPMRINNWKHIPWIVFVIAATIAACILYVGNFHPGSLPAWIPVPASLIQKTTEHHTVGGTPLGLWFGSISLAIFVFAILLSLRKKIPLWRVGTVQRWLRAHIWLTILTIPLVVLHSGFRLGGGMTTLLMVLYAVVMVSGFYGLFLQHIMPRLMKERLPAETVYEQIPHIRSQLAVAAGKMRDSFKSANRTDSSRGEPAPPKKPDPGAPAPSAAKTVAAPAAAMASTKSGIETPAARAKSATGSEPIAVPVTKAPEAEASPPPKPPSIPNAAVTPAPPKPETIGTPTARVQSDPPGEPVARAEVPAGDQPAPSPPVAPAAAPAAAAKPAVPPKPAAVPAAAKAVTPPAAKPAAAPKPAAKPAPPPDPASEEILVEFIERQILPYLEARRGERMRLNNARFSDDTFRFVKLRVTEGYRSRVEEIQAWCDERRMLDVQVRLHHWLHGWLFIHVPFSFLLVLLTIWHAFVTLFYY